jgi:hypothetical protein
MSDADYDPWLSPFLEESSDLKRARRWFRKLGYWLTRSTPEYDLAAEFAAVRAEALTTKPFKEDTMPTDRMLQFFAYDHLPELLQEVSKPFHTLAHGLVDILPSNPERTVALRKLLEAKDCAVRALIFKEA